MSQQAAIPSEQVVADQHLVEDVVVKAKTSFYWAMRLLPAEKRQAMFAVYAFCRVVDDIADGDLPEAAKLRQLQGWREEIERLYAGDARDPIARALIEPIRRFDLAREDFLAMIDGMETDARGGLIAPAMADLELYCSRVAGAVGLLSVRIFEAPRQGRRELAHALGEAVQLTNVLRDLDEDAGLGRLYLPRELLQKHGVPVETPSCGVAPSAPCRRVRGSGRRRRAALRRGDGAAGGDAAARRCARRASSWSSIGGCCSGCGSAASRGSRSRSSCRRPRSSG